MEIFFGAIKSTFDASFLPSQFSPTLLHVCYLFKALEFPFAAHSPAPNPLCINRAFIKAEFSRLLDLH